MKHRQKKFFNNIDTHTLHARDFSMPWKFSRRFVLRSVCISLCTNSYTAPTFLGKMGAHNNSNSHTYYNEQTILAVITYAPQMFWCRNKYTHTMDVNPPKQRSEWVFPLTILSWNQGLFTISMAWHDFWRENSSGMLLVGCIFGLSVNFSPYFSCQFMLHGMAWHGLTCVLLFSVTFFCYKWKNMVENMKANIKFVKKELLMARQLICVCILVSWVWLARQLKDA